MPPAPYPHRVCVLPTVIRQAGAGGLVEGRLPEYAARVIGFMVADALDNHPVCSLFDPEDERWVDGQGALLSALHPSFEFLSEWHFRDNRRHELLWFEWVQDTEEVLLVSRRPVGPNETFAGKAATLGASLTAALHAWLAARRLEQVGDLGDFSAKQLWDAATELATSKPAKAQPMALEAVTPYANYPTAVALGLLQALAQLRPEWRAACTKAGLRRQPAHIASRYWDHVLGLRAQTAERRDVLALVEEAPMYGRGHLPVWGEAFEGMTPGMPMQLRHQGIAASLMPTHPYALHNYAAELQRLGRFEEAYRWACRAADAAPTFFAAQLDCVRFAQQTPRVGHALAEAQHRFAEISRYTSEREGRFDWQARFRAGLLLCECMIAAGRYDEAIAKVRALVDEVPPGEQAMRAEVEAHLDRWQNAPEMVVRAAVRDAHFRADIAAVARAMAAHPPSHPFDAAIHVEALLQLSREDEALIIGERYLRRFGIHHDKLSLVIAKLHILRGELLRAVNLIHAIEARTPQGRGDADMNRLWRLCAIRDVKEWDSLLRYLLGLGAKRRARMLARNLADFVPGIDATLVETALGPRPMFAVETEWFAAVRSAVPEAAAYVDAIDARLELPLDVSLGAADRLVQDWWKALPSRADRVAHASSVLYALAVSLARYLSLTSGKPTPLAGAYRHVATEALYMLRRARFDLDDWGARGLLEVLERCKDTQEWLLDAWMVRIERALDLEAENGGFLAEQTNGLPAVAALLRGDERVGWEHRMADDLRGDAAAFEAAAYMLERCARSQEGGMALVTWSQLIAAREGERGGIQSGSGPVPTGDPLDVHWLAAAATDDAGVWERLVRSLGRAGLPGAADAVVSAAVAALEVLAEPQRGAFLTACSEAWPSSGVPHDRDAALLYAAEHEARGDAAQALLAYRWVLALSPGNAAAGLGLARIYLRQAQPGLAGIWTAGLPDEAMADAMTMYREAGRLKDLVTVLRVRAQHASAPEQLEALVELAHEAQEPDVCVIACERALALSDPDAPPLGVLLRLAEGWARLGEWQRSRAVGQRLLGAIDSSVLDADGAARWTAQAQLRVAAATAAMGEFATAKTLLEQAAAACPTEDRALLGEVLDAAERGVPPTSELAKWSSEAQAYSYLMRAQRKRVQELASQGNSWQLFRAALASTTYRGSDESGLPVASPALHAAKMVLERSAGTQHRDGVLCRLDALVLRDEAYLRIDAAPLIGKPMELAVVNARLQLAG